jgi:hypothetical protein
MSHFLHLDNFSKKTFFRYQKIGWRMMGFWLSDEKVTKFQFYFLLTNCMLQILYGFFQLWFIVDNRSNLVTLFDAMTPFLTQVPTIFRLLFLIGYRAELKGVLNYLKGLFERGMSNQVKIIEFFFINTKSTHSHR